MTICSSCGGSGIQRVGEQQFRTCLACLGQGCDGAQETEQDPRLDQMASGELNAVASSAAAR